MSDRDQVLQKVRRMLMAYLSSRGMTREDSEDVVQESMLVLSSDRYKNVEAEADLVPLAFSIVKLKRLEFLGAIRHHTDVDDVNAVSPEPDPQASLLKRYYEERASKWLDWLRKTISKMSEPCRSLLTLRLEGLSTAEISKELGKKENNILVMEFRCRNTIRRMIPGGAER